MPTWVITMVTSKAFWIVILAVGLVAGGWYVKGVFDERASLREENQQLKAAQRTGQDLQRSANQADANLLDRQRANQEARDAKLEQLESQLTAANHSLRACVIDAGTLRVLNNEQGAALAGGAAGARPGPSTVETDKASTAVSCEDLARRYEENRGVYNDTADQVQAWRKFYNDIRMKYCAATGAC